VLPGEYSPVILHFDTEMEPFETEKVLQILQISSGSGAVEGDIFWNGNELHFIPVHGWTAGVRYTLSLTGTIHSIDGRELRLERFIAFYAINQSPPPLVTRFSPADGESVGSTDTVLELRFSCPMERISTETSFTLEGTAAQKFEWAEDDTVLKIIPEKSFGAWISCRWGLKTGAKSRDGVPLAKAFSARFSTDRDRLLPAVQRVFPALNSDGRWIPTGGGIECDLGPGQGIVVEFNKPAGDNILRSLRFDPPLAGRIEALSDNSIIFIPNKDPEPETAYTLIVSAEIRDSEGLKPGEDFRIVFVPDIPYLKIISFSVDNGSVQDMTGTGPGAVVPVPAEPANGEAGFTIGFSLPLTAEEKQNTASRISLVPFFPRTLEPVALRSVTWISDDRIRMKWERLKPGDDGEAHYYKLSIPGGKGGVTGGGGMYFREDQFFYLEAVQ
jgi:hypothetical protein